MTHVEMVAPDIRCITNIVRDFVASTVVLTTTKRMVIWCPDLHCAKALAIRIEREGYHCDVKKGTSSQAWYVQAGYLPH